MSQKLESPVNSGRHLPIKALTITEAPNIDRFTGQSTKWLHFTSERAMNKACGSGEFLCLFRFRRNVVRYRVFLKKVLHKHEENIQGKMKLTGQEKKGW